MSLYGEMSGFGGGAESSGIISGVVTGTVKENYDQENPGKVKTGSMSRAGYLS